jgi:cyclic dehypoxanthinyl futalosine synthase
VITLLAIDHILKKSLAGERINVEECIALFESDEVEKIGNTANQIMLKWHPEPVTTFVIGRNINYTNICDVYCKFCAFYRAPGSKEGYVLPGLSLEEAMRE